MSPISLKIRAISALLITASPLRDTLRGRGIARYSRAASPRLQSRGLRPGIESASDEELFTEFANTLHVHDGLPDDIGDETSLRAWLIAHGLVAERTPVADAEALRAFHDLRVLVHEVTERLVHRVSPSADQLRRLNRVMRDGLHYHQLQRADGGARFTVRQVGDALDQARAAIADSLAHYLADHDVARLRICASDRCEWRFIDRSPSGRRRWCDMRTCGNRAKVARHRERARRRSA